ncbi:hypothetical protein [Brevundimonas diminuta]|uniref:hypothetical protein n=1 Tax=Brevundimonas diminuta TaxID=293 RepID=UPI003D9A73DE
MGEIRFGFISMWHGKGGQHTNGPDYGVVTAEHELAGVKVEIQTCTRVPQHKARLLAGTLVQMAVEEMRQ